MRKEDYKSTDLRLVGNNFVFIQDSDPMRTSESCKNFHKLNTMAF